MLVEMSGQLKTIATSFIKIANEKFGKGVFMKMLAGVSMPIIVRKGDLDVSVGIEDLSVVDQGGEILTNFPIVFLQLEYHLL